jgi:hypothetical protein
MSIGSDCEYPESRLELLDGSGDWVLVRDWNLDNYFVWETRTLPAGTYEFRATVRSEGLPQTEAQSTFTIEVANACSDVTLYMSRIPPEGGPYDNAILFTAEAACGSTPEYAFYWLPPGATAWQGLRDYSTVNQLIIDPNSYDAGEYRIQVWARNESWFWPDKRPEAWTARLFNIDSACEGVSLVSNTASPSSAAGQVVLSASTRHCGNPEYRFWRRDPSGVWSILQDWSSSSAATWETGGASSGAHDFQVWARRVGQPVSFETWAGYQHQISP